jgi:Mrp family chromosome partitioning ATPase
LKDHSLLKPQNAQRATQYRKDKSMKLAVSGKGGVGKTTFASLLIRVLPASLHELH